MNAAIGDASNGNAANAYLDTAATSSGLPIDSADAVASFTSPSGQHVQVIVKAPRGLGSGRSCLPPQCYLMRAIQAGELPDEYFPAAVTAALTAHATRLVVPRATYDFKGPAVDKDSSNKKTCNEGHYFNCSPHWTIGTDPNGRMHAASVMDLDIDLSGAVLNFAAPGTGIWILNAARVRLENFSIDWPALHIASLGTIVPDPANRGHRALVLDGAYPAVDALTGGAVQIQAVDPWEDSSAPAISPGRFKQSATNDHETYFVFGAPQPTYLGKTIAGGQTFSCASCRFVNAAGEPDCSMFKGCANFDRFSVGERVIVRHYTYNGFALLVNWSSDIDLEKIHLLTGPGMGIAVQNDGGFRGFRLADSRIVRGPGRLISTASDGINVSAIAGDIIVENNEVAYQGDDGINVSPSAQTPACTDPSNCDMVDAPAPGESFVDLTQQPVARYVVSNNYFHENRGQGTQAGAPFGEITGNTYFRNSMGAINLDADGIGAGSVLVLGNILK